jgi:phosphoribosylformylglycinamidine cyclo-ligase
MDSMPQIQTETFLEAIMKPHTPYYKMVKCLFGNSAVHGMAHITGGGIEGNLSRIMPRGLSARIDLGSVVIPEVFKCIKSNGGVTDSEMLKTFNCGVGLIIVGEAKTIADFCDCYTIGEVVSGTPPVSFENRLKFSVL